MIPRPRTDRRHHLPRGGFTLVELLVTTAIIAAISALAVPVIINALSKARTAAVKTEIDMLHMAIMQYRNEHGSFPPCLDLTTAPDNTAFSLDGPALRHLRRLFPACQTLKVQTTNWPQSQGAGTAIPLTPYNALVAWLDGFTPNPVSPLEPRDERVRSYDFDRARITSDLRYHPRKQADAPYVYISTQQYSASGATWPQEYLQYVQRMPVRAPNGNISWTEPAMPLFNDDTFQILNAGKDGVFNTDDDLSNFWPGTRAEFLASLKKETR
jgi:prepilin-type N-terminal cleavage/methylation domain-containing protein